MEIHFDNYSKKLIVKNKQIKLELTSQKIQDDLIQLTISFENYFNSINLTDLTFDKFKQSNFIKRILQLLEKKGLFKESIKTFFEKEYWIEKYYGKKISVK